MCWITRKGPEPLADLDDGSVSRRRVAGESLAAGEQTREFLCVQGELTRMQVVCQQCGGRLPAPDCIVLGKRPVFPGVWRRNVIAANQQTRPQHAGVGGHPLVEQLFEVVQATRASLALQVSDEPKTLKIWDDPSYSAVGDASHRGEVAVGSIDGTRIAEQYEENLEPRRLECPANFRLFRPGGGLLTLYPDIEVGLIEVGIAGGIEKRNSPGFQLVGERGRDLIRDEQGSRSWALQLDQHCAERGWPQCLHDFGGIQGSLIAESDANEHVGMAVGESRFGRDELSRQSVRGRRRESSGENLALSFVLRDFVHFLSLSTINGQLSILDDRSGAPFLSNQCIRPTKVDMYH